MKNLLTATFFMIAIHFNAIQAIADMNEKAYNNREGKRENKNQVEIYITSWCRYCKEAIAFLNSNRIQFKQYDIEKDSKSAAMMKKLGGTGGVPFAIINGKKIYGFSKERYKQELGLP
jgi:glutaredoxin